MWCFVTCSELSPFRCYFVADSTTCGCCKSNSLYSEAMLYEDLEDLIKLLQPPIILFGDFNIRHPMWGDTSTSPNANIVIDLITKHNLVCMNSVAPTHYYQASQSFTHIDISLCSNTISHSLIWSRL